MNGVSRGAELHDQQQRPVLVLDRSPEGWWVYVENEVDERGYPLVVQVPEQELQRTEEGLF